MYGKESKQLLAGLFLAMGLLGGDEKYNEPIKREEYKPCACRECGSKFLPISDNKRIFCSAECYKTYKQRIKQLEEKK